MMQAVILVGGNSSRAMPLTASRPKAFLSIAHRPLLTYVLDAVCDLVDEIILVTGSFHDLIKQTVGDYYKGIPVVYVRQDEPLGSAHALDQAKSLLRDRFFVLNGSDYYTREALERCKQHNLCVLAAPCSDVSRFGEVVLKQDESFSCIREKEPPVREGLANTGAYLLSTKVFSSDLKKSSRNEFDLTDYVTLLAQEERVGVEVMHEWSALKYSWDVLKLTEQILPVVIERRSDDILSIDVFGNERSFSVFQDDAEATVLIGKNTIILPGVHFSGKVIVGDDCTIGPNCVIRGATVIGDNCIVGQSVEIKNSVLYTGVKAKHLSYLGDSVIDCGANIGAGTIVANVRHDGKSVSSMVKGVLVDSYRRKFGAIIGAGAKTGVHTSVLPGRKFWPNSHSVPGEVVNYDKVANNSTLNSNTTNHVDKDSQLFSQENSQESK